MSTITLSDGFNGHTEIYHSEPIDRDSVSVQLACARPGKKYLRRWAWIEEWINALEKEQKEN